MRIQAYGFPWFDRDDYESFKPILPDRRWHPTYDEWLAAATQAFEQYRSQGKIVIKAYVYSNLFPEWCRSAGHAINSQALTQFANEVAARAYMGEKSN